MATAGAFAARLAEVAISNAASTDASAATYVDVEKVKSPKWNGKNEFANAKNNDDGGVVTKVRTWGDANLTFEMVASEGAAGQEHCWTAWAAGEQRAFRLRPKGNNPTDKEIFFLGIIVDMSEPLDADDVGRIMVTVERSGSQTRQDQP